MSNQINNKTLRALALGVSVGFTACALGDEIDWFNVSFNGYTQGQQLSDTGATGGTWHSPIPDIATNVHDGVRNGIAINAGIGEALAFEPYVLNRLGRSRSRTSTARRGSPLRRRRTARRCTTASPRTDG